MVLLLLPMWRRPLVGKRNEKATRHFVVAQLLGVSHQAARGVDANLDRIGWKFVQYRQPRAWKGGEQNSSKRARLLQESTSRATSKLASGNSGASYLPELSPSHYDEDEDMDFMDMDVLTYGSHHRRRGQAEQWR